MEVRLLTFNALFRGRVRARLAAVGGILERSPYDVVCLQEVMSPLSLRQLRRAARSYGHLAHGPAVPLIAGGLVIMSRWPITGRRFQPFRRRGLVRREWVMRKGALVARVQIGGRPITIVNTHLSANMADDWSPASARARVQAAELNQLVSIVRGIPRADPLVVLGDFNVARGTRLFAGFVSAAGLRDVLAMDTRPTYRPTPGYPDTKPLDQVLVRPGGRTEPAADARLVFREPVRLADGTEAFLSDHYGIEARLAFDEPAVRERDMR